MRASTAHARGELRTNNAAVLHHESLICGNSLGKYTVTGFSTRRSPLDQQFAMHNHRPRLSADLSGGQHLLMEVVHHDLGLEMFADERGLQIVLLYFDCDMC